MLTSKLSFSLIDNDKSLMSVDSLGVFRVKLFISSYVSYFSGGVDPLDSNTDEFLKSSYVICMSSKVSERDLELLLSKTSSNSPAYSIIKVLIGKVSIHSYLACILTFLQYNLQHTNRQKTEKEKV